MRALSMRRRLVDFARLDADQTFSTYQSAHTIRRQSSRTVDEVVKGMAMPLTATEPFSHSILRTPVCRCVRRRFGQR